MYNSAFRALRVGATATILVGIVACYGDDGTSANGKSASASWLSDGARLEGTTSATLELKQPGGAFTTTGLSRSRFAVTIRDGKTVGRQDPVLSGQLFVRRSTSAARDVQSFGRSFAFTDREGHFHALHIQRATGIGPITRITHYRDGVLAARTLREWRTVREGWIADGSTLEIIRDGEVVGRVRSSVRAPQLAARERTVPGASGLVALAGILAPAELQAQQANNCSLEASEYGEAYTEVVTLIIRRIVFPVAGPSFGEIGRAFERYEHATSELQRCLTRPVA